MSQCSNLSISVQAICEMLGVFSATYKPKIMGIGLITLRINKFNHWLGYDKTVFWTQ